MLRTARALRLAAWLAWVAMLGVALLPTLSRAMAFGLGADASAEVCTTGGPRSGSGDRGPPDGRAPLSTAMLGHCALCPLASDGLLPLPAASPAPTPAASSAAPVGPLRRDVPARHAWRSAQPRGPPA